MQRSLFKNEQTPEASTGCNRSINFNVSWQTW
jgi:hypothetical protein